MEPLGLQYPDVDAVRSSSSVIVTFDGHIVDDLRHGLLRRWQRQKPAQSLSN
jgi:hypothetical protein